MRCTFCPRPRYAHGYIGIHPIDICQFCARQQGVGFDRIDRLPRHTIDRDAIGRFQDTLRHDAAEATVRKLIEVVNACAGDTWSELGGERETWILSGWLKILRGEETD